MSESEHQGQGREVRKYRKRRFTDCWFSKQQQQQQKNEQSYRVTSTYVYLQQSNSIYDKLDGSCSKPNLGYIPVCNNVSISAARV